MDILLKISYYIIHLFLTKKKNPQKIDQFNSLLMESMLFTVKYHLLLDLKK